MVLYRAHIGLYHPKGPRTQIIALDPNTSNIIVSGP